MEKSIDDVIYAAVQRYTLELNEIQMIVFQGFVERQLKTHPEYDLDFLQPNLINKRVFPYVNLMRDKLMLFSYLHGEIAITAGYSDFTEQRIIGDVKDLYLLRPAELGAPTSKNSLKTIARKKRQTDSRLLSLYNAFKNNHANHPGIYMNWREAINEISCDPKVVEYLKRQINYDLIVHLKSPNPLTFDTGGDRYSENLRSKRAILSR